ncbi:MAG TPA: outer membrane beta-barrel protein, partial [Saprospiraceae bacterium]|nr:outer membrane beta-barrel protein [Saprospiraceae bacterium]
NYIKNFTNSSSFIQNEDISKEDINRAHRFNLGWRSKLDSVSNLITSANVSLSNGNSTQKSFSESLLSDSLINNLNGTTLTDNQSISANAHINYLRKGQNDWKLFKLSADITANKSLTKSQWENISQFFDPKEYIYNQQFQNINKDLIRYNIQSSLSRNVGNGFYLIPGIEAGGFNEVLDRKQGIPPGNEVLIDSLSPYFTNIYQDIKPGLTFKKSTRKTHFRINAQFEIGKLTSELKNSNLQTKNISYFLPALNYEYEYGRSRRYSLNYNSYINLPDAVQLLGVLDNTNPLQFYKGNPDLKAEYQHDFRLDWIIFDEFSFTSFFANIGGTYTKDKINFSRVIASDLSQFISLVNVKNDYRAEANMEYSTPIRKFGLTIHGNARETFNRGINLVNGVENINTNFRHELSLSFDNRKKDKWDINFGANVSLTNSAYSIQAALNNHYLSYAYFGEINYSATDKWHITFSGELTHYNISGFDQSINIPLLKSTISHYFLSGNRGVISLEVFDILNKNTGIERISELNYLLQRKSNIIRRYAMLSFKYRLNKFGNKPAIDIQINH